MQGHKCGSRAKGKGVGETGEQLQVQNGSRRGTGADANRGAVGRATRCVATWTRYKAMEDRVDFLAASLGKDDLADSTNGVDQVLIQVWRLTSNQVKCRGVDWLLIN